MNSNLSHLLSLDPTSIEFEVERSRLIKEMIERAPEPQRKKMQLLQLELDLLRVHSTPEEFMNQIVLKSRDQVENLEDLVQFLKNTLVKNESA